MCAHDAFNGSGVRLAPHLVADFTDLSKEIADIIAKYRNQDKEERQRYELVYRKAKTKVVRAKKAVAAADKKLKAATAKAVKSGSNAPAKAKQNKSLVKAQKVFVDAQAALAKASKAAAEAWKKAEAVIGIQLDIVERWKHAIAKMKPAAVCVGEDVPVPTCTESCELYLAQCAKCKGSKCQCA